MPILETTHLTYTYPTGSRPALTGVSLQVESGEFVALIGANNAGKSTLCYALAGIIPHFFQGTLHGQVLVEGQPVTDITGEGRTPPVGLVLQNPARQFSGIRYTVFEEVAFGLENLGVPRGEMGERVSQALAATGLAELADRSPYQLSGGQQQRLAIAAILALSPPVLVLDEPTTLLDPQGTQQVFELLRTLKGQGKTILLAEQRLEWVAAYADRVIALAGGEVVLDGPPQAVLASPELERIGLESPRYTQVAGLARQKGIWPPARPLAVTFDETVSGLSAPAKGAGYAHSG